MAAFISVLGSVLSSVGGILISRLLTAKVAIQLICVMLEKLINSPKTGKEVDKALAILKKSLEEPKNGE